MAYLGQTVLPFDPLRSAAPTSDADRFSGNGSTTTFTLSRPVTFPTDLEVFVENIQQEPINSYSVVGTSLVFTEAPPSGTNNVYVVYRNYQSGAQITLPDGSVTYNKLANNIRLFTTDNYTSNAGVSTFTMSEQPADANTVLVTIDGIVQRATEHYSVSGRTITFTSTPAANSLISIRHLGFRTTTTVTAISPGANLSNPIVVNGMSITGNTTLSSGSLVLSPGTAGQPALSFAGNTSTGIFFPATSTIAFSEGGTEAMRIDASGNMGIGTSSPAQRLSVIGNIALGTDSTNQSCRIQVADSSAQATDARFLFRNGTDTQAALRIVLNSASFLSIDAVQANNSVTTKDLVFQPNGGNVGIGTTSPTYKIQAHGTTPAYFGNGTDDGTRIGYASALPSNSVNCFVGWVPDTVGGINGDLALCPRTSAGGKILFFTGTTTPTERARITSGGDFYIGTTTNGGVGWTFEAVGYSITKKSGTATTVHISFQNNNGEVGKISTSGTATTYGTSSDYRLKENVQPMSNALAKVAELKPVTYKWKVDGSDGQGFIAHELQSVCPDAVIGEKDAVEIYIDDSGTEQTRPVYQAVDTSFLIATLTAAIQELKAIVDAQAAEIAALKGTA